jgi:NAD(P)-dependent dehydrogenase (short-subunit alcohol dehydrogenase family)
MIWEMSEEDWDLLQRNNLKAVFAPLRWASVHWKERSEAGDAVNGAVINISSMSGLNGMPGQSNYTAAKAGVAALTVATSRELARFGVRVNGILPEARTRMSLGVFEHFPDQQMFREIISSMFPPGEAPAGIMEVDRMELADLLKPGDTGHPARVSPAVAYLATADCPLTGQLIEAGGTKPISVMESWRHGESFANDGAWWTIDEVAACLSTVGREAKV